LDWFDVGSSSFSLSKFSSLWALDVKYNKEMLFSFFIFSQIECQLTELVQHSWFGLGENLSRREPRQIRVQRSTTKRLNDIHLLKRRRSGMGAIFFLSMPDIITDYICFAPEIRIFLDDRDRLIAVVWRSDETLLSTNLGCRIWDVCARGSLYM